MERGVVVGYDGAAPSAYAVARARQVGRDVTVLCSTPAVPGGSQPSEQVARVAGASPEALFAHEAMRTAAFAVLTDCNEHTVREFRHRLISDARNGTAPGRPVAGLLVTRNRPVAEPAAYTRVVVGTDGSVGSGLATLAGGAIAAVTGATLEVVSVERRRSHAVRELFDRLQRSGEAFDASGFRRTPLRPGRWVEQAIDIVTAAGVHCEFSTRHGDPADYMLDGARHGELDLLTTGAGGPHAMHRYGRLGRVAKRVVHSSPVDHLLVFDPVSLGLASPEAADAVLVAAGRQLFGEAHAEVAATATLACPVVDVDAFRLALAETVAQLDEVPDTMKSFTILHLLNDDHVQETLSKYFTDGPGGDFPDAASLEDETCLEASLTYLEGQGKATLALELDAIGGLTLAAIAEQGTCYVGLYW